MRKILLIALALISLPLFSQNDYQYRLSSFMSDDATHSFTYNYADPSGTDLLGVHEIDLQQVPVWELTDSLQYDEEGRIIQIATHQCFDGEWRKVCWIDYTYNEMGLKETRKNYNDFNDGYGPILGGIYYYYYDEEGRMTNWTLDFDNYDFQKCEFFYNEEGLLEAEIMMQDAFTGVFENENMIEYYYDENNNLIQIISYYWGVSDWVMEFVQNNTYDEVGNCIEMSSILPDGTPQQKRIYKYDENVLSDNVYYYPNPENKFPTMPQMHNMVTSYEHWGVNQDTYTFEYICDFIFSYEALGEIELSVTANASSDTIVKGETVELNAEAYGGTEEYTYTWTPAEFLNDASAQNPTATITEIGTYTFTVIVNDGENTAEASVSIEVISGDGVEEQIFNKVNIYPNPAQDFIMIDSENIDFVEVIDIYGRVITSAEVKGETRIDMSNFANGIYYVRLHSKGTTAVQKVVKD